MTLRRGPFLLALWLLLNLVGRGAAAPAHMTIWDTRAGRTVGERALLDRLAQADVVFLGEQHDDPATHVFELHVLRGLHERLGGRLTLAMEMWERDVQVALDAYLQGTIDEPLFLKQARPWSNYATDYRPLVEYAKASHIPVVASNAPQKIVTQVGRHGLAALAAAPPGQTAALIQAPQDDYWRRFAATMRAMGGGHGGAAMDPATIRRFYEAQVVRDETMAESVARWLKRGPDGLVLHVNGQFHSDYGGGVPRRVLWRRPLTRSVIVSVLPVADVREAFPSDARERADFVVLVRSETQQAAPKVQ